MFARACFRPLTAALALGALLALSGAARADRTDVQLTAHTDDLFKYLKAKGAQTVGVLKFRGQSDGKPELSSPDSFLALGPLGSLMAERLEVTLINGIGVNGLVDVIHDASAVAAARNEHLSYLEARDRKRLFELDYPLAVGDKTARPDLFLTGVVRLEKGKARVTLLAFGPTGGLEEVPDASFSVPVDRTLLSDAGRSFVLPRTRSGMVESDPDVAAADDARRRVAKPTTPAKTDDARVDVKMFFGDEEITPVPVATLASEGRLGFQSREPRKGETVRFEVKNLTDKRLAVVVKVNGVNTINQETTEADRCTKWILEPNKTLTIDGFYDNTKDAKENRVPFGVKSEEEVTQELLGNTRLGVIDVIVFEEGKDVVKRDLRPITRGLSPLHWQKAAKSAKCYADLREAIDRQDRTVTRGLIAPDGPAGEGANLVKQDFNNPRDVEGWAIRYYAPKK
jgi:hypothetical protein